MKCVANDRRCLSCSHQITCKDVLKSVFLKSFHDASRLRFPFVGELRSVVLALNETRKVPTAFAVTNERESKRSTRNCAHDDKASDRPNGTVAKMVRRNSNVLIPSITNSTTLDRAKRRDGWTQN